MYLGNIITIDIYLENTDIETIENILNENDIDYTIEHIDSEFITISVDIDNLETLKEII